jgi:AraC family transcriptional regulator
MDKMNKITAIDYRARINRVIDYIENNISNEFNLDELSYIAGFSRYHFHRIFLSQTGENIFQFVQRIRLERAAILLQTNRSKSITEIALACGFTGSAVFARSFKKHFKKNATNFRKENAFVKNSNAGQTIGNKRKENIFKKMYVHPVDSRGRWKISGDKRIKYIEIKNVEDISIIYIRYTGNYKADSELFLSLFERLFKWTYARELTDDATKSILIYHDAPAITDEKKLRVSVCLTVRKEIKVSGEIGKLILAKGKYAVVRAEVTPNDFEFVWNWIYGVWLPESGYLPGDKYCFEVYQNSIEEALSGHYIIDVYIPVVPA